MPSILVIIDTLRQRLNRWAAVRAASWWVAVVLLTMLCLFAVDAVVRGPESGWRWLQFSVLVAVSAWAARRYFAPLRVQPSRAAIARLIESRVPELRDRLSSAVLFLEDAEHGPVANGPVYDSPQLRERVILETAAECAERDFAELLSPRSLRRALFACGGLVAVVLGLAVTIPQLLGIGFLRQIAPWRETQWPRQHELYIEAESVRLARGETFHAAVLDQRGTLPRDLILHLRSPADQTTLENTRAELPLAWQPDRVAIRHENVQHDFEFRVSGGDDRTMAWTRVQVLEPARLAELTLRVIPPAHTRWPAYTAEAPLAVLPGSSLALNGRTTRSLKQASLDYAGQKFPLQVAPDQQSFHLSSAAGQGVALSASGKLHFEFTDAAGVVSRSDAYEARLVPDQAPTVEWGSRAAEELLTPGGEWSFSAAVRDDVAIERVELLVTPVEAAAAEPAAPLVKELYQRPSANALATRLESAELEGLRHGRWPEDRRPLNSNWRFSAPLPVLDSRWQAVLRIIDSAGQSATSEPRTLRVVSPDELSARMSNRWNELLRDLITVSEQQQAAQRQVIENLDQPTNAVGAKSWLAAQRQIGRELTLPSAKIPQQLAVLTREFAVNQLQQTASGQRLATIQTKLDALRQGELAKLESALNAWEQATAAEQTSAEHRRALLAALIPLQAEVQQRLREVIDLFDQQSNWSQLERALQAIQQTQQTLRADSLQNENLALGRSREQLTAHEQTILGGLAQRQTALADQFSAWQNMLAKLRLDAAAGSLAAEGLRTLLLQRQPAELMRSASGNLAANRTGQATQQQAEILAALAEALEILRTGKSSKPPGNPKPANNEATAKKPAKLPEEQLAELRKLQEQLTAIEQQQTKLNQQTIQFAGLDPDQANPTKTTTATLAADQESLHAAVTKLAVELGAEGPFTFQLQRVAQPMQAAVDSLRQNDAGTVTQREQQIALDRLRLLLQAFASGEPPPPKEPNNKSPTKENPQQAPKLQLTPQQIAELRLIRALQLELTARTAAVTDAVKSITEPTAAEQRAAAQVAAEQETLREMLQQLIRETLPAQNEANEKGIEPK